MIEWADPPTKAGTAPNGRYARVVTDLQTRPGQWALVGRNEHCSLAVALRKRGCETRTVTTTRPPVTSDGETSSTTIVVWRRHAPSPRHSPSLVRQPTSNS